MLKFIKKILGRKDDDVLNAYVTVNCVKGCGTSLKVTKGELLTKKFVICPDCVEILIAKAQRKRETKPAKESDRQIVSRKLVYNF